MNATVHSAKNANSEKTPLIGKSIRRTFASAGEVVKTVANDENVRFSSKRLLDNLLPIAQSIKGISHELSNDNRVRRSFRTMGASALTGSGIASQDQRTGNLIFSASSIKLGLRDPKLSAKNAVAGVSTRLPMLIASVGRTMPDAVELYKIHDPEGPKRSREATDAVITETIALPFHAAKAAYRGVKELRKSDKDNLADENTQNLQNNTINEQSVDAVYQGAVSAPTSSNTPADH